MNVDEKAQTNTAETTAIDFSEVFKALASEHRREILRVLSDSTPQPGKTCCSADEVCACKISEHLGLAASTITHHMSVLRKAGLIDTRKDGQWSYYTLRRDVLDATARELSKL